jgi:hypothetical protein
VHIPYHLTWRHEHVDEAAMPASGWHRLNGIQELGGLLETLGRPGRRANVHKLQSRSDRT